MKHRRELWLPESEAQAATLVRAVEETDRDGELVTHEERRRTAGVARASSRRPEVEAWIGERSLTVIDALEERIPSLPALLSSTRLGRGLTVPILLLAFVAGLATNVLGPSQRIQVLALPLLGLIAWNLASLLLLVTRGWLLRLVLPGSSPPRTLGFLERLVRRSVNRQLPSEAMKLERGDVESGGERALVRQALATYVEHWFPVAAPLASARLRRVLHASALVLVAGVVADRMLR